MADCKNHCSKRTVNYVRRKFLSIPWICLFVTSVNCFLVEGERIRHHHDIDNEYYRAQLEKSSIEDASESPVISCPNCFYKIDRDLKSQTDNIRLEAIKRQILSKLGLRHKPNVTHSLPRELILETLSRAEDGEVYSKYFNPDEDLSTTSARISNTDTVDADDFYGRTSEIISFGEGFTINGNRFLDFRITTEPGQLMQELRIRSATLWLKADLRKRPITTCQQYLWAFRVRDTPSYSNKLRIEEDDFGTRQEIDIGNSGWQKLNLTDTVRRWLAEGNTNNLRILIDCSCSCPSVHLYMSESGIEKRNNPNRPFLVIYTEPNVAKRVRRRALDCLPDSGNQCCKQRFYVSFKDLGWDDWVIAPQGYFANYCRGDCGNHRTPDTFITYHAHVIEEMRKSQHLSGMQPCCAPLKFSSMSMIYFGPDSNIIKRDLPKMVVDECGCP